MRWCVDQLRLNAAAGVTGDSQPAVRDHTVPDVSSSCQVEILKLIVQNVQFEFVN